MTAPLVGQPVLRLEDDRLLRGDGIFIDDITPAGCLSAAFLRSPAAHGRLTQLDVSRARRVAGVAAVYTADDLGGLDRPLPLLFPHPSIVDPRTQYPLARKEVVYQGQTLAMVVAESRYVAEDALESIEYEIEPLPAVVDPIEAREGGTPVHSDRQTNVASVVTQTVGDVDRAFREADVVLRERYVLDRGAAMPMETRGVVAHYDRRSGQLVVWDSTQAPIPIRAGLVAALGLPEERVRVVAPDVGGGFGVKAFFFYPEEMLVPWASVTLDRPLKWIEDRGEHFVGSTHERSQVHDVEIAATGDGTILALRDSFVHDAGASIAYGITIPLVTASHLGGQYRIPNLEITATTVYTNTVPTSPYRGAGRPHACFVIERALDDLAERVGSDRIEIRRRNFVRPDAFPYARPGLIFVDGETATLDSGDYDRQLSMLLELVDEPGFRREQREARKAGRYLGLGLACYVEATAPPPYEGAHVIIQPQSGKVRVATGITTQGQSHMTTLAQLVADELGAPLADVVVVEGDTDIFPWGVATYASRAAVIAGNAVAFAAAEVRDLVLGVASNMLEAAPEDLELAEGRVFVRGAPSRGLTLRQVALAANPLRYAFDPELAKIAGFAPARPAPGLSGKDQPGLESRAYYSPPRATWACGAHAAVVEIDPETGDLTYLRYAAVHDCGRVINPVVVEGQIHGGIAQGIGGSFYEQLSYDEEGQLRNASFMDYLVPSASELPPIDIDHLESLSPLNPLGIKGAGEAGVIPVAAVTASAVDDALGRAVAVRTMPLSPASLHRAIDDSAAVRSPEGGTQSAAL